MLDSVHRTSLAVSTAHSQVVVNEIHYEPRDKTERGEFVELYNAGNAGVDLSGWKVDSGATFEIPPGTRLAAQGFLVIAEAPEVIGTRYSAQAIGPLSSKLSFSGDAWAPHRPHSAIGKGGRTAFLDELTAMGNDEAEIPPIVRVRAKQFPKKTKPRLSPDQMTFLVTKFKDPQDEDTFAGMTWRLAEVSASGAPVVLPSGQWLHEWNATWTSGELTKWEKEVTIPPDAVRVGGTYRVRVRMKDTSERWCHWSTPVELTVVESGS